VKISLWKSKTRRELEALQSEFAQIKNAAIPLSAGVNGSTLYDWLTNGISSAGKAVNEHTAMCVTAVYSCVRLIGSAIAGLPLHIYRRTSDGRERVDHDLWWLLNEQPHPTYSAAVFWEYLAMSILLHGDAFARILRASPLSPNITGFEALHPQVVNVQRVDGRLKYIIYYRPELNKDGKTLVEVLDQDDMLHIPGVGFDGLRSMSPLRYSLKTSVGIALAADEWSASFFANGARPDFALTTPNKLEEESANLLRKTWAERHGGSANAHLPAILTGGLDIKQLTLSAADAQLIATREFQIEDIARAYGVPPHMIGHTDKATSWGTGIENMGIGFVKYTLRPYLNKIEQEFNRKCFKTSRTFVEFNVDGLMEGDSKAQAEYFGKALGGPGAQGWMSVNEVRKLKNLKPLPEFDKVAVATQAKPTQGTPNAQ